MLPRPQPGACLVIAVGPPAGNARDPRAFSGASFAPIEFPTRALPTGWLPAKCTRTSRISKWVSTANAQGPRAIFSGSFGTNERLKNRLFRRRPAANRGPAPRLRSGPRPETRETPAHFQSLRLSRSSSPRPHCRPVECLTYRFIVPCGFVDEEKTRAGRTRFQHPHCCAVRL